MADYTYCNHIIFSYNIIWLLCDGYEISLKSHSTFVNTECCKIDLDAEKVIYQYYYLSITIIIFLLICHLILIIVAKCIRRYLGIVRLQAFLLRAATIWYSINKVGSVDRSDFEKCIVNLKRKID